MEPTTTENISPLFTILGAKAKDRYCSIELFAVIEHTLGYGVLE